MSNVMKNKKELPDIFSAEHYFTHQKKTIENFYAALTKSIFSENGQNEQNKCNEKEERF